MRDRLPVMVIDPGHGGQSPIGGSSPNNATGVNGLLEKNLTLDLARRLPSLLADTAEVILTRTADVNLALTDRARVAHDHHASLFLSIHLNGFHDAQVDGTEVWVARQAHQQSRAFAQTVLRHLTAVTGMADRGVKQGDLGILLPARHDAQTAACLVEVAFQNPSDRDWQSATNGRYLQLALDNFAHFAPSDPSISPRAKSGDTRNHRDLWEQYHGQALRLVRQEATDQALNRALAINAFGDHFLTDAFAAGHLFNKADISNRFNSLLMTAKGELTAKGQRFFSELAKKAFTGALKATFSKHETAAKYVLTIGGYQFPWVGFHPNIHNAARFEDFLKGVHNAEPRLLGESIVAKIIHDKLNSYPGGVAVSNGLGEHWNLRGDGTVDAKNLAMMRKAVTRSVYNVAVEAAQVKDLDSLYGYVWQYTPRPTSATKALIVQVVKTYTTPDDPELIQEAANLLQEQYQLLLDEAVERGELKPA